jgi:hypothetical protein
MPPTAGQMRVRSRAFGRYSGYLRDLHACWSNNDALLAAERKWFNIGILALALATTISLGLYAWALT